MISTKKNAQYLAAVLLDKGIRDIIISPGSRNAPLINTFTAIDGFRCLNIVDERCAAFFALGMALKLNRPVAIACTSGSAVLNYAPAIVEAYYQKVPLLVLTADRPPEWIDQGDGQTIRQGNIYANYIKGFFNLSDRIETEEDVWFAGRLLHQALNTLLYPEAGPVQINVPFPEPLYGLTDDRLPEIKPIVLRDIDAVLPEDTAQLLVHTWNSHPRRMILTGQMAPDPKLNAFLNNLAADSSVAVLTETLANLSGLRFNGCIDNALSAIGEEATYRPDLLITVGGQIVSKKIKAFLRKHKPAVHWHFSPSGEHMDTFMSLTDVIPAQPHNLLQKLKDAMQPHVSDYGDQWRDLDRISNERNGSFLQDCPFCDLKAFESILSRLPAGSVLHLSNSTPVRYAQLFHYTTPPVFQSNRGTSGIDGVVSTAAGYASAAPDQINTVITGDLAFLYDSNALWIKHLPGNLRIIVINNGGGGIFRFIDGAPNMPELETHFEARHRLEAAGVARAFGIDYFAACSEDELKTGLDRLYDLGNNQVSLLEIITPTELNAVILKQYFNYLKG
jgi:2-succinyl-5-enolpyruvyl-6-hydroxy-3-cyclohexene-1-carboxylate synthase